MCKTIYHIYYNTSGNSGLYLNPIYDALKEEYEQRLFVSFYYPLELADFEKCFFAITERNEHNPHHWILRRKIIRYIIRYIELKLGNKYLLREISKAKPDIVNYSLTNMPDALKVTRKIKDISPNTKIIVTCHDVSPLQATNKIPYQKIYNNTDYLLVHNKNSIRILMQEYRIPNKKIIFHPFPLIDLSLLKKQIQQKQKNIPTFLFIGVMRQEKGLKYLINAWKKLGKDFEANLIIAGFKPENVKIDFSPIAQFNNVKLIIKSLSDDEYFKILEESDYVVFPYIKVGNSGVLSSVVSMCKVPITTELPLFQESVYVNPELMCIPKSVDALEHLIRKTAFSYRSQYSKQRVYIIKALQKEKRKFANAVKESYSQVL